MSSIGLQSSNASHEIKEKQNETQRILNEIKKYIDKKQLPNLLEAFKEVKTCETIDPVYRKLKSVFFGNVVMPSRATDKYYREKVQCFVDLANLIPKSKQDRYK